MFYSHEILTSPEHGVATIWLVATLGSRSITRRLNRKTILGVDVPHACRVIVNPEAPMALRLQGSLLYGVSRVYNQQCGYTLLDVQAMHDKMLAMLKVMPGGGLDPTAGKIKPNQLILPYDPAFSPETCLPGLQINLSMFDTSTEDTSNKQSGLWSESPGISNSGTSQIGSIQLELPPDDILHDVDKINLDSDVDGSVQKRGIFGAMLKGDLGNEEGILLQPDFEFDEHGNIVELGGSRQSPSKNRRSISEDPLAGATTAAREEQRSKMMQIDENMELAGGDDFMTLDTHSKELENLMQPEEPDEHADIDHSEEMRHRHARGPAKVVITDNDTMLPKTKLAEWNESYLAIMAQALKQKQQNKGPTLAKRNAAFWVYGQGIGSVGVGLGVQRDVHPLTRYSGEELYNAVFAETRPSGRKRTHSPEATPDGRRMRAKDEQAEHIGRGNSGRPDLDVEIGRQAPSSVYDDHPSQMPWNISASILSSRQRNRFGSVSEISSRGRGDSAGPLATRPRNRLTSASPLARHGYLDGRERLSSLSIPGNIGDELEDLEHLDLTQYLENELATDRETLSTLSSRRALERATSTLDQESLNFLEFFKSKTRAPSVTSRANTPECTPGNPHQITFSTLLPPEKTTRTIATQGLMNVLTLATKGVMTVYQEPYQDESIEGWGVCCSYGEIFLQLAGM